jgi:signal transduction histidine kinase
MPQTLFHKGIVYALNEYINKVNDDSHLEIIFEFRNIPEISPSRSIHIFRILQEIIHNTLKHSQADTLKIKLFTEKDKLIILTADDGVGFNYPGDIKNNNGLGLQNLENRANLLNGALHIHSVKGNGTRYHIALPL